MRQLPHLATALVDLVLPGRCIGCARAPDPLCPACRPHGPPLQVPHPGLRIAAAGEYEGALRAALVAYKERGRRDLAAPLARLLAGAVAALDAGQCVLVGVPSARALARSRGGDHVARLSRRAARQCGVGTASPLCQVRRVRDSAGLGAAARCANVAHSMRAAPPGASRVAMLVDDIVTTGSTLAEAHRALRAAGWVVAGPPSWLPPRVRCGRSVPSPLARPGAPV